MSEKKLIKREDYKKFYPVTTRWMDNDLFGHINNVVYYSFFDTAVNRFLIETDCFKIKDNPLVFYVVHSSCNFASSLAYPDEIEAGLMVKKVGNSSVTYGVSVFKKGVSEAAAYGEFVHVFVNQENNKSAPIPNNIRTHLEALMD
ncbi:MAG: thioesterase [Flavobacteriales bacterium MED-G15]|nr:MAG: thioesterase [Flavobacteriales bacterium MED-G15]|tara:strand:+ start:407 stop:841 length:435 start_codon:yes stop_codon:yes gene_type:complete